MESAGNKKFVKKIYASNLLQKCHKRCQILVRWEN